MTDMKRQRSPLPTAAKTEPSEAPPKHDKDDSAADTSVGSGISNQPQEEEKHRLPPRGERRDPDAHA